MDRIQTEPIMLQEEAGRRGLVFDTMDPNTIFEKLRLLYGNNSKVARMLKIDPRVYRRWRAANRIPRITKLYLETLIIDTNRPREDVSDFS